MATKKKLLQAAAGQAGGEALNVEDVFSTYLYEGNGDGSAATNVQTINNGIDLSGEGGMVWIKGRSHTTDHIINDTVRGAGNTLQPNLTDANQTGYYDISQFNSDGFGLDAGGNVNANGYDYASWTFRKAPKFFDVVTYTGTGSVQTIAHNLGSVPGCIIVKLYSGSGEPWEVYHRGVDSSAPEDYRLTLNTSFERSDSSTRWNDTAPTSTEFTVGTESSVNGSGATYVAYLFAHNDGDGEFGPDSDLDIIKCGSYTGTGAAGNFIDLGFEPQFVIRKSATGESDWFLQDSMRSMSYSDYAWVFPNNSLAESGGALDGGTVAAAPNGFIVNNAGSGNTSGQTFIYMAIRRGTKVPESATEVFAIDAVNSSEPYFTSGFPIDMAFYKSTSGSSGYVSSRLTGLTEGELDTTAVFGSATAVGYDKMTGFVDAAGNPGANYYAWMWKRAPGFFDVVAYTGNGSPSYQTINHNLKAVPQLLICKSRDTSTNWPVTVENHGASTALLSLNTSSAHAGTGTYQDGYITGNNSDSTFLAFSGVNSSATASNASGVNYIAYLFATLPGISKVGSFTGNGGSQTIDCGFTSGARFVLIKRVSATSNWLVFDTERGIVSGNDPYLFLDASDAEDPYGSFDEIDPHPSGFTFNYNPAGFALNGSGSELIFYAIA